MVTDTVNSITHFPRHSAEHGEVAWGLSAAGGQRRGCPAARTIRTADAEGAKLVSCACCEGKAGWQAAVTGITGVRLWKKQRIV